MRYLRPVSRRLPGWRLPTVHLPSRATIALSAAAGGVGAVVAMGLLGIPMAAVAAGLLAAAAPIAVYQTRRRRHAADVTSACPGVRQCYLENFPADIV